MLRPAPEPIPLPEPDPEPLPEIPQSLAVYPGPLEQIEIEVGPVLAGQDIPDNCPTYTPAVQHPEFVVRPL